MESYQSNFLRCDFRNAYSSFYNELQWPATTYNHPLPVSYSLDPNVPMNSMPMLKNTYSPNNELSIKYPLESTSLKVDLSSITSTYIHRSKDDMHSLFGDPCVLLTQLIDELEDSSSRSLPSNTNPNFKYTIYNSHKEHDNSSYKEEKFQPSSVSSTYAYISVDTSQQLLQTKINESKELVDYKAISPYNVETSQDMNGNSNSFNVLNSQAEIINPENPFFQNNNFFPTFTSIERPRRINKNRGDLISASGLSFSFDENLNQKNIISRLDIEEDNEEYEANLDKLLKQMDRREFQESWSKDWSLGLIRFCKYMQLSEKMQLGPDIKLKSDDNKCIILVLKKVFQSKPPAGWPNHGVRLQIQCGGYLQDILAWSSINRETWKTIMPLIAKGITQLIKKVGGVHKLKNGHQPYFNACRNALREDNSLFLLLKEYSRGVNSKKRKQNISEYENKETPLEF